MSKVTDVLKWEIEQHERELKRLREALNVLTGGAAKVEPPDSDEEASVHSEAEKLVTAAGRGTVDNVREVIALGASGTITQRDIAVTLGIAPGTVSKCIKALVALGEVTSPGKLGRTTVWEITPIGLGAYDAAKLAQQQEEAW